MPASAFALVLLAAALHAGWNALVKRAEDSLLAAALVSAAATLLAAAALPFLRLPSPASWNYIAASSLLQIAYLFLLARVYRVSDMSQTYPLMRGSAPLLVALAGAILVGERLSLPGWLGIGAICAGILTMAAGAVRGERRGVALALLNAVLIAAYTLVDGLGVRVSGAPISYSLWVFVTTCLPFVAWVAAMRTRPFLRHLRADWPAGLIGGAASVAAYALALWAMTVAPIALVSALRETSSLFATAISAAFLRERVGPRRIAAASAIVLGAIALRAS